MIDRDRIVYNARNEMSYIVDDDDDDDDTSTLMSLA